MVSARSDVTWGLWKDVGSERCLDNGASDSQIPTFRKLRKVGQPHFIMIQRCASPHHLCWSYRQATRSGQDRLNLPFFDLLVLFQPPRLRATAMQAARNSSARARSTIVRATTIPPMDKAAMLCAVERRRRPFSIKLRSRTLTIALKTVSKARFALTLLRATSVGNATMGQEFSTSSKC